MKDGKLFGKINIIDLIVLIAAIIIVVAVGLKMTGKSGPARVDTGTSIHYTVKTDNIEKEMYENIKGYIEAAKAAGKPGDQLMASGELLNGYVVDVIATPSKSETKVVTSTNTLTFQNGMEDRCDLVFKVDAWVNNNVKTELGTQEIRVGKNHILKTTHFELGYTTIMNVEWEGGTGAGY